MSLSNKTLSQVVERYQNNWKIKSQDAMRDLSQKFLALAAALIVMQLVVAIFKRRERHRTFKRMRIPGPEPNIIHGQLFDTRREPYVQFAHRMHEKFGTNVGIYLGGDPYLMTKDLDLIQQVFVTKSRQFYDRMNFYLNIDPVPDNLICQRGDRWRYMRKLLTPAFSNSKIKSSYLYRDTQQTIRKFMRQLEENSERVEEESVVESGEHGDVGCKRKLRLEERQVTFVEDLYDRMAAVALDVIVKTAFHMDNMISFSGPLNTAAAAAAAASASATQRKREPLKFGSNSHNHNDDHGKLERDPGESEDVKLANQRRASIGKQEGFLSTVKQACRLAFNPLVEMIFCFPFLDLPLTYLCNQLYFGSIIQLLFDRLDYLVRRSDSKKLDDQKEQQTKAQMPPLPNRRRIIDNLIEVLRERKITKSEFTGNAFVIVFAGFETTANALTFTLWLLAKHQDVQKKLRTKLQERINELKQGRNTPVNPEGDLDYENNLNDIELAELATGCEYLEMVINESLRLFPPVPGLSCRQAAADCTLANGMHIERGVNVIPSVFTIHRDKAIWGDSAHEFEPERFEVLDVSQLNSAMFMPFGLGPRNCIGKALAIHEIKIAVGRLVLEYSLEFWPQITPCQLRLCSPINITITSADKIGLKFVKL